MFNVPATKQIRIITDQDAIKFKIHVGIGVVLPTVLRNYSSEAKDDRNWQSYLIVNLKSKKKTQT